MFINPAAQQNLLTQDRTLHPSSPSFLHRYLPDVNGFQPGKAWQRFKDLIIRPSPLQLQIRAYVQEETPLHANNLLQAFSSHEYPKLRTQLIQIFQRLSPEQTFQTVQGIFREAITPEMNNGTPEKLMERLMDVLSLSQLEASAKSQFPSFQSALESAVDVAKMIKDRFAQEADEVKKTLHQSVSLYIVNFLEWIIDSLMVAFQLNDLTEDPEMPMEAQYRLQMLMGLFTTVFSLLASLTAITGNAPLAAAILASGVTLMGSILYIYFRWLKPCPENVSPLCTNLTSEAAKGNILPLLGRGNEVRQLIEALCSNGQNIRRHPLLIGKSGVGKTELIKELARLISIGDVPDELKDLKVFHVNTGELVGNAGGAGPGFRGRATDNISKILKKIRRFEGKVLFFFDEIHLAFPDTTSRSSAENAALGEKLKTLLDPNARGFKFFVGATTPEEFEAHIADNWPFVRRFNEIYMDEMGSDKALLAIKNFLHREAPHIRINSETIQHLYDECKKKFPQHSQPYLSIIILSQAIARLRNRQQSTLSQQLQTLLDQKSELSLDYIRSNGDSLSLHSPEGAALKEKLRLLDLSIAQTRENLRLENERLDRLDQLEMRRHKLKEEFFKLALKIFGMAESDRNRQKLLKQFILMQTYLNPALNNSLSIPRGEGLQQAVMEIDTTMINLLIAEFKKKEDNQQQRRNPVPQEV